MNDLGGVDFGQKRGKEGQSDVNHTEMRRKYDRNRKFKDLGLSEWESQALQDNEVSQRHNGRVRCVGQSARFK